MWMISSQQNWLREGETNRKTTDQILEKNYPKNFGGTQKQIQKRKNGLTLLGYVIIGFLDIYFFL